MSDLIERLRLGRAAPDNSHYLMQKAADEIERLTALVKVLESDDHEWYLQAARIEKLEKKLEAANECTNPYELWDWRLGEDK